MKRRGKGHDLEAPSGHIQKALRTPVTCRGLMRLREYPIMRPGCRRCDETFGPERSV
jgi:hypothetical protein